MELYEALQIEPNVERHDVDYGAALRRVRMTRRCWTEQGIHWTEPGQPRCQCGKLGRVEGGPIGPGGEHA